MLALQVIQKQVECDETNLVFIFSRKIWVTARLLCRLLITRAAYWARDDIECMACKLIDS
jgi:hypothetical protein